MSADQESPQLVFGRLLEAAHFGGYAAERVASEFKWLVTDGRWKQAASGFDDIDKFLASINLAKYRISIDDRKEIVKLLEAERATQRASAKALGVGLGTINSDVQNRTRGNGKSKKHNVVESADVQTRTEHRLENQISHPSATTAGSARARHGGSGKHRSMYSAVGVAGLDSSVVRAKAIRKSIDKVRIASGLAVYEKPLTKATCEKCKRGFYWRVVPAKCGWPGCDGKLQMETE